MKPESGQYARGAFEHGPATSIHHVLDNLREGCQVISPDWTISYANSAAANQVLKSREQLLGRSLLDCFPGIERTAMFDALRRCMSERQPHEAVSGLDPNCSHGRFELRFVPVPEGVCVLSLPASPATMDDGSVALASAGTKSGEPRRSPTTTIARVDGERPLVLVVEDDPDMSRFITRHLAKRYRVAVAFDGREGLQKARELRPDLILTDTVMPIMTGEELVSSVRDLAELDSVPIIVLSARTDEELRVELLRSGAQDYITKPCVMAELRARVENLLQRKLAAELVQRTTEDRCLLAEVGAVLGRTLDYETVCSSIADLATKTMADVCILDVLDQNGESRRLNVAHRSAAHGPVAASLERVSLGAHLPHLGSSLLQGRPWFCHNQVSPSDVHSMSLDEAQRAALLALAPRAILGLPLQARGHLVGTIVWIRTSAGRPFVPHDVKLADEVAQRAAMVLDNAGLCSRSQRAIQMRDDVLGIVAHDLRSPLNAMLLQLQLFRRRGEQPERRSQEPLEAVLRQGERLNRLIQDLLDVARIEARMFAIRGEILRMSELAREIVASYRLLAAESSLRLVLDVSADDTALILGDQQRLLQALGNLLDNAIKFTPPGGTVTVRAVAGATDVELSVVDSGPGIDVDQLPHLFDRYWQGTHADRRGAGLGLWIAKAIVEAHGGRIRVESAPAKGSTFFVVLPRAPDSASS